MTCVLCVRDFVSLGGCVNNKVKQLTDMIQALNTSDTEDGEVM